MLVGTVAVDLDKLFEDGGPTSSALDGEASRVVEVTVDGSSVLVVGILRTKDGGADGACKVLDVELHIYVQWCGHQHMQPREGGRSRLTKCCDITPSQRCSTLGTQQTEASKVVRLTQWVLSSTTIGSVDGEELGGDDLAAILYPSTLSAPAP